MGGSGGGTTSMNGVLCVSLDRKLLRRCSRKLSRLHARGLIIGSENWLDDGSTGYAIKATDKCKKIEKYDSLGSYLSYQPICILFSEKKVKYYIKVVGIEWKENKYIIITNVILFLSYEGHYVFPFLFFPYRIKALSIFPTVVQVSPTESKEQDMQMAFAKLQLLILA